MARRRRSPDQMQEMGAFIKRLYVMSKSPSWAEFARTAKVPYPNITEWKDGKGEPLGWNLYSLIKVATESQIERLEASAADVLRDLQESVREVDKKVEQTRTLVAEGFELQERLHELEAELSQPQEDHPPQAETP